MRTTQYDGSPFQHVASYRNALDERDATKWWQISRSERTQWLLEISTNIAIDFPIVDRGNKSIQEAGRCPTSLTGKAVYHLRPASKPGIVSGTFLHAMALTRFQNAGTPSSQSSYNGVCNKLIRPCQGALLLIVLSRLPASCMLSPLVGHTVR